MVFELNCVFDGFIDRLCDFVVFLVLVKALAGYCFSFDRLSMFVFENVCLKVEAE